MPSTRCTRTPWPGSPPSKAGLEGLTELLVGPTALTFVADDSVAAAKALRDTARTNPLLVLRGGALGTNVLTAADITALADLPSREELLARFAGALQAPLVKTAGLLQALPRNFAYGLQALIDQQSADAAPPDHPLASRNRFQRNRQTWQPRKRSSTRSAPSRCSS